MQLKVKKKNCVFLALSARSVVKPQDDLQNQTTTIRKRTDIKRKFKYKYPKS